MDRKGKLIYFGGIIGIGVIFVLFLVYMGGFEKTVMVLKDDRQVVV